jgi:hypothetical protein
MNYTRGALKAAEVIMNGKKLISTDYGKKSLEGIADLIDRETAAPEMYEALKELYKELHASRFKMDVKKDYSLMVADSIASKVLFKAEGRSEDDR